MRISNLISKGFSVVTLTPLTILILWALTFSWNSVHHISFERNLISGTLQIDTTPGPKITYPWVQVSKIDTRPVRVCVQCQCHNMTCNLVSFDRNGWMDFIDREGFGYYWWRNRFSYNSGHDIEYRGVNDILMGYSMDGNKYTFLKVHE